VFAESKKQQESRRAQQVGVQQHEHMVAQTSPRHSSFLFFPGHILFWSSQQHFDTASSTRHVQHHPLSSSRTLQPASERQLQPRFRVYWLMSRKVNSSARKDLKRPRDIDIKMTRPPSLTRNFDNKHFSYRCQGQPAVIFGAIGIQSAQV
jgi:hypothetical protein